MKRLSSPSGEDLRASLWCYPALAAAASGVLTLALLRVRPAPGTRWAGWLWPGTSDSAATMLQVVAGSTMTATTLTFSLTVVALQLASQQFSPRLLRSFASDRFTQTVLAVLASTYVVALTSLRGIDPDRPLPVLAVGLALLLGIVAVGSLLGFVGHIVRALRVDTMMVAAHGEVAQSADDSYPDYDDRAKDPRADLPGPDGGTLVPAVRSGFVTAVRPDAIVRAARELGVFVRLGVRPGDHLVVGAPVASVWRVDGVGDVPVDGLQPVLREAVEVGFERTMEQDVALGLRQLTDIAVKAISPGVNDPITCAHAVGYCSDLLVRLLGKHLGPQQHDDVDGVPRLVTPDRDLRYYLDLVCGPVRRFGRDEPIVLTSVLRLLRDCAVAARDDTQREQLERQVQLVVDDTSDRLLDDDVRAVEDLARRVRLALCGDVDGAFRDRAGETRSV